MPILMLFLMFLPITSIAQSGVTDEILQHMDDELNIGGDIFSNFQEDIESAQVLEDERFYRFGRFYSVNLGFGITSFLNNRGNAYNDKFPSFMLSLNYFFNFHSSLVMGAELSNHVMDIDFPTVRSTTPIGRINVSMLRAFIGYRYYLETNDLSAIFTNSNPYFTARFEYWYQTNKFQEAGFDKETGGGVGAGIGVGVEFPLKLKERYLGFEMLIHPVSLLDSDSKEYNPTAVGQPGFSDLNGPAYSLFLSINETW